MPLNVTPRRDSINTIIIVSIENLPCYLPAVMEILYKTLIMQAQKRHFGYDINTAQRLKHAVNLGGRDSTESVYSTVQSI